MTHQLPEYKTYDLGCASALASVGFEVLELDKSIIKKVQFIFRKNNELDEAVNLYWSGKLKVDARRYFEELKNIKNRIYSD